MLHDPTFSRCLIDMRPIGLFRMKDDGLEDLKILGVPQNDPLYTDVRELKGDEATSAFSSSSTFHRSGA